MSPSASSQSTSTAWSTSTPGSRKQQSTDRIPTSRSCGRPTERSPWVAPGPPGSSAGSAEPAANRSAIVEFLVEDVDATYASLQTWVTTFVNAPTTMPWGNRSLLLRDPGGNLVHLFSPATPAATEKFSRYER